MRFLKQVKYGLYTSGDGRSYLGFAFVDDAGDTWAPQPVSGPYTSTGLTIVCRDRSAAQTVVAAGACSNNGAVSILDFTFRSETNSGVSKTGTGANTRLLDSMKVRVVLRNNT